VSTSFSLDRVDTSGTLAESGKGDIGGQYRGVRNVWGSILAGFADGDRSA